MPLQTGRDLHIDTVMSNILIGRQPQGYIADQLVPILNVSKQSDVFYRTNRLWNFQYEAGLTARAPATEARKISFTVSSDTYYAKNYALGADWPVEDEVNADEVLQWANQHGILVTDRLKLDYEMRIAALANASTSVGTTTHVATPWTAASALPIDDIDNILALFRDATGLQANVAVIPDAIYLKLRQNPQVRDLLFGDRGGVVTDQALATLIGVDKVLVPRTQVHTGGTGETILGSVSLAKAWNSGKMWVAHVSPLPGRMVDTWMQAFRWTSPLFNVPWAVQRYPFDERKKVYGLEVNYYQGEKVISPDLAIAVDSLIP